MAGEKTRGSSLITTLKQGPLQVVVFGGGNFGTAMAKVVAENCATSYIFGDMVKLWCIDEMSEERSLVDMINDTHTNPKYLPGVNLPRNLIASSDIVDCCQNSSLLVFVVPHQYLKETLKNIQGHIRTDAKAISLIKGCMFENAQPVLCSELIESMLGIDCCALSGANIAKEIAGENFCESTIGYEDRLNAAIWQQLFDRPYFRINCLPDKHGVQICGCIKNVVALSVGFCDGLGYGTNTKATIMRLGVDELRTFACMFYDGIREETFLDSAGYADVITTCFGGRNVRCAREFVIRGCNASWDEIETDLLNGQKLQGHLACQEVYDVISTYNLQKYFPLFVSTYRIAFERADPATLLECFQTMEPRRIKLDTECNRCIIPPVMSEIGRLVSSNNTARLVSSNNTARLVSSNNTARLVSSNKIESSPVSNSPSQNLASLKQPPLKIIDES